MKRVSIVLFVFIILGSTNLYSQFGEPEVRKKEAPRNLYNEGYRSGFGFTFSANDFGFGVGTEYRRVINTGTEFTASLLVAGIKDPKEQTYIDYFFGFRTVPDKYRRVISIPLKAGLKKRLFAEQVSDNFRIFGSSSFGPVLAFSFPYFEDDNNNGFRENSPVYGNIEPNFDAFTGWKNGESHFGWTGDIGLGIDFGENFGSLQSMKFNYNFFYFEEGIQIMQPRRPDLDANGNLQFDSNNNLVLEDHYDPRKFLGSAQISFTFGWMWK